jgi:DNA-binding SARP family transcriptional activator
VGVDATALRRIAGEVIVGSSPPLEAAVSLMRLAGELLPTWDEEWLVLEREELRQIQLQAFECCASRLSKSGNYAPAMTLVYEAIRADPARESLYRLLIAIHLAQGNRVQAIQAYRRLAKSLWDDYQIRPSRQLEHMVREEAVPVGTEVEMRRIGGSSRKAAGN